MILTKNYPPGMDMELLDEIDLSAIVPAGAIAVHLSVQVYHENDLTQMLQIRQSNASAHQAIISIPYVVNITHYQHGTIKIDPDRKLNVYVRSGTGNINLRYVVLGWFI